VLHPRGNRRSAGRRSARAVRGAHRSCASAGPVGSPPSRASARPGSCSCSRAGWAMRAGPCAASASPQARRSRASSGSSRSSTSPSGAATRRRRPARLWSRL
jgi:hypothetical protein